MSDMRAIAAASPSWDRTGSTLGKARLVGRPRFLGSLPKHPHDHHPLRRGGDVGQPGDSAAASQPYLPQTPRNMFDVRLAHTLRPLFLDEFCDAREPCPNVFRQSLDLHLDALIQGLDRPAHNLKHTENGVI